MRLSRLVIHGYRKLVDTECKFTGKLTAIVGANEAGKSSLIEALLTLQDDEEIPGSARPYGLAVNDDDDALEVWYRLSPEEQALVASLDSDVVPTYYVVVKRYDGERAHRTEPEMVQRTTQRQAALMAVTRFEATAAAKALPRTDTTNGEGDYLDYVSDLLQNRALDSELAKHEGEIVDWLVGALANEDMSARGRQLGEALVEWQEQMSHPAPDSAGPDLLSQLEPRFAVFRDEERNLRSGYPTADVADNPPVALANWG